MTDESTALTPRANRISLEDQCKAQGLELAEGETPMRYRDIVLCYNAVVNLGHRHLPTKAARIHVARCVRALKPDIEDFNGERTRMQAEHAPDPETLTDDGGTIRFVDAMGLNRKFAELELMVAPVRLPSQIKDDMLPQNDKAHPNNEDGLPNVLADLGPLFMIDTE